MMKKRMMAKTETKIENRIGRSLAEHTKDLLTAYRCIVEPLSLSDMEKRNIYIVCVLHDLGKINSKFQNILAEKLTPEELLETSLSSKEIKHNLLSPAFMLPILDKMDEISEIDRSIMTKAVMLHHGNFTKYMDIGFSSIQEAIYFDIVEDIVEKKAQFDFSDLEELLKESLEIDYHFSEAEINYDYYREYNDEIAVSLVEVPTEEALNKYKQQYIEIKGFLNLLDHIASSREGQPFKYNFTKDELMQNDEKLLGFIRKRTGKASANFNEIQQNVMKYQDSSIVITEAFTSSGKTVCDDRLIAPKKLYLAPNRISAMSFYEEACEKYQKENVGVLHGAIHLYASESKNEEEEGIQLSLEEIELARNFVKPYILATVDQLAIAIFKHTNYEKTLAVLKDARVCVDELHLLSPRMFQAFLLLMDYAVKHLNTKFHLMTATLPTVYQEKLAQLTQRNTKLEVSVNKAVELEDHTKNVLLSMSKSEKNVESICKKALENKQQVLIIRNTIDDVIKTYQKLRTSLGATVQIQCLHSRFREEELKALYRNIIEQKGTIWIATQTVEIALDIDFPVVISDLAPMDSLVQRMGRNNRKGNMPDGGQFYLLPYKEQKIYPEDLLISTEKLIKASMKDSKKKETVLLTMNDRKELLEKFYEEKKVNTYFEKEFARATYAIKKIFGLTHFTELTGDTIMYDNEPYQNVAETKKEAEKYFRDAEMKIKIYLEEDAREIESKEDLLGKGIAISGRLLYRLKQNNALYEKYRGVYILRKNVYEYGEESGLIFKSIESTI